MGQLFGNVLAVVLRHNREEGNAIIRTGVAHTNDSQTGWFGQMPPAVTCSEFPGAAQAGRAAGI